MRTLFIPVAITVFARVNMRDILESASHGMVAAYQLWVFFLYIRPLGC